MIVVAREVWSEKDIGIFVVGELGGSRGGDTREKGLDKVRLIAVLGEMLGSGKASEKLLMMYVPFMGIGILATLRGLVSRSTKSAGSVDKRSAVKPRRKLA
ncbi:hypothetical protein F2Q70_00038000 [Brassica cretica]|uniref:Uncharacterized protein n=1 Tax=Brassica cretica TaxID=69181 RepID=A0A8S9K8K5_BRACR|nr:hypothetical protein F2Q70_00038000 [Brassica cretica]